MKRALFSLLGIAGAALVGACGAIIGVEERYPGKGDASSAESPNESPETPSETDQDGATPSSDASTDLHALSLGQFVDPRMTMSNDELLVDEIVDGRSKLTLIEKAAPTKPRIIYDQPADDPSTRISTIGIARSEVWFTTVDGKLHHMSLAGTNPQVEGAASSSILAASPRRSGRPAPTTCRTRPRCIGAGIRFFPTCPKRA
ncbi:hypothetical protein AKJ09_00536 [Labilithrix luteola]|uniref:Lipoprotein n=1 Tax=Labilithrix luteola TaxID=1391654 RepID=A0A0K1PK30_9BACT|nr:hypothetical protein [Labilithrix luteola]AKU93872.1 hypothetical protein AKJ09_00536 [Labilithrix luteola]